MKIDFSNPPASSRTVLNPVQTALNNINASKAKFSVSKSSIESAINGQNFKLSDKTVELYAPVRIKKNTPTIPSTLNLDSISPAKGSKIANLYKLFMV